MLPKKNEIKRVEYLRACLYKDRPVCRPTTVNTQTKNSCNQYLWVGGGGGQWKEASAFNSIGPTVHRHRIDKKRRTVILPVTVGLSFDITADVNIRC